ncbi:MAG: DUF4830 domain-containing protein [Ruminococcaceae bacterium]|nr:DUF4830 domain-containing protein [Oscillospiraceae bacterium]
MFVFSFKLSTLKYIGVMAVCTLAIVLTVVLVPTENVPSDFNNLAVATVAQRKQGDFKNVKTNEDRIKFLESYGWEIDSDPVDALEVIIPETFDKVYEKYNEIQKSQGLDLEKYKGKSVLRYTYTVKNHSDVGTVYANLLIYKNRVIGADVSSAVADGFVQGLER